MHYLDVLKTPVEVDGKVRAVDDFQPRKQCKDYLREGKLSSEEDRESFSNRFIVDKVLLKQYMEHLQILEINKRKKAEKKQVYLTEQKNKTYKDYDWMTLFKNGSLNKLKVNELDKYLHYHKLCKSLKLKKREKVNFIKAHIASTCLQEETADENYWESDDDSLIDSDDSADDLVLENTVASSSDSSDMEEFSDISDNEMGEQRTVESIFTTTRGGRVATYYRAKDFVSLVYLTFSIYIMHTIFITFCFLPGISAKHSLLNTSKCLVSHIEKLFGNGC